MSEVSGRLAALSPDKRALLERALLDRRRAASTTITPRDRTIPAPLSASQQRLWFFDQLTPGEPTYNAIVAMWLDGDVDVDLLESAVDDSIRRHEVIRTVIELNGDEPVQRVLDSWDFAVERVVAEGQDPAQRAEHAVRLAGDAARISYDLAHDLTLRVLVVAVEPQRWLVAFLEHHIAFDGWSDEILFREISEFYAAGHHRVEPSRPAPAVQYADFAVWQSARIGSGDFERHATYWRTALDGAPDVLALPLDHPRPQQQSFAGRHLPLRLEGAQGVRQLRAELGATDFMVLVAAWAATLYRWSGQSDIVLGTPMANRNRIELEELIGFFSNTVPLRVRVDGAQSFRDLVRQVTESALDAFDHQDLPFEKIVEVVAPRRDPRINPLFQVNIRVQAGETPRLELAGVDVEPIHIDVGFSRFDLAVEFQLATDHIGGYLEYNQSLLEEASALAVIDRLQVLLTAVLADPDRPIWDLPQPVAATRRTRTAR